MYPPGSTGFQSRPTQVGGEKEGTLSSLLQSKHTHVFKGLFKVYPLVFNILRAYLAPLPQNKSRCCIMQRGADSPHPSSGHWRIAKRYLQPLPSSGCCCIMHRGAFSPYFNLCFRPHLSTTNTWSVTRIEAALPKQEG